MRKFAAQMERKPNFHSEVKAANAVDRDAGVNEQNSGSLSPHGNQQGNHCSPSLVRGGGSFTAS
jgi:hypothetical protein